MFIPRSIPEDLHLRKHSWQPVRLYLNRTKRKSLYDNVDKWRCNYCNYLRHTATDVENRILANDCRILPALVHTIRQACQHKFGENTDRWDKKDEGKADPSNRTFSAPLN